MHAICTGIIFVLLRHFFSENQKLGRDSGTGGMSDVEDYTSVSVADLEI